MRYDGLAILLAATLAGNAAFAGGVTEPAAPPVQVVPTAPVATDWTGAYGGIQLEFGNATIQPGPPDPDFSGSFVGVFAGYRVDLGSIVVGGELDYVTGELTSTSPGSVDDILRAGLEVGYDAGPALFYATAGWATVGLTDPVGSTSNSGAFYGAGVDFMLTDRLFAGVEILHHDFNDVGNPPPADADVTTLGLNVGFRF
jgi:opacity protein-like surface antigen